MTIQTISALVAAIGIFVIGWSVVLRDRHRRPNLAFALLCFNLSIWYLAHFFAVALHNGPLRWISLLAAAAIPITADAFFRIFLARDPRQPLRRSNSILIGTIIVYVLLAPGLIYPLHHSTLFLLPFFAFVFASLYQSIYRIHIRRRSSSSRAERLRLTYLLWGGAAAVTLTALDFLPLPNIAVPTVGRLLAVVYAYFLSQTLFHYRLLDINELLGEMVTLSALVLIQSVIFGLLLVWVDPQQPSIFLFNTVVASFVILVIFDPLRAWLEDRVYRWMFAAKHELEQRLRALIRELANVIEVRSLAFTLMTHLEHSGRVTHASVYFATPPGRSFRVAGHLGPKPPEELDARTRRVFIERLRETGILTVEGVERVLAQQLSDGKEEEAAVTRIVIETMAELLADVCLPLVADNQVLGLLNLRDDRLREAYASDELELLREVAAHAAVTLHNSQAYEQMKERDRLAALGQMAAGLAHEIRNPLGAIKGAAQLLKADAAQGKAVAPERAIDHDEFLEIIVGEVNRLDHVVSQFLGYARPDRGERRPLDIPPLVERTAQLLRSQASGTMVDIDVESALPQVRADPEQLRQVFLNLGLNALQAMDGKGRLKIETRQRRSQRGGRISQMLEVVFRDEGPGIPAEHLSDIFIPFFTTRSGGTGLGLPICHRIVESHGGSIEVQSAPGQGSTFSVLLPISDVTNV